MTRSRGRFRLPVRLASRPSYLNLNMALPPSRTALTTTYRIPSVPFKSLHSCQTILLSVTLRRLKPRQPTHKDQFAIAPELTNRHNRSARSTLQRVRDTQLPIMPRTSRKAQEMVTSVAIQQCPLYQVPLTLQQFQPVLVGYRSSPRVLP